MFAVPNQLGYMVSNGYCVGGATGGVEMATYFTTFDMLASLNFNIICQLLIGFYIFER